MMNGDEITVVLCESEWNQLMRMLAESPIEKTELSKLLKEKSVLEESDEWK